MWKVVLPIRIPVSKKSYFSLNLNIYRNSHYQTLNKAKIVFKELVKEQIDKLPIFRHIHLKYVIYLPNKRRCDISNIGSVVDKFFSDSLVELGHLEDDNYHFLDSITYEYGGIDIEEPRVEVFIQEIENADYSQQE